MEQAEQFQRRSCRQRVRVFSRKKHDGRAVFRCALQIVEHVVRPQVGVNLAYARQEDHVVRGFFNAPRNLWNEVRLRVQYALQQLFELRLFRFGFNLKNLLEYSPIFEDPE